MRKFTSLMLMLLCAVTAWAGPTDLPEITTDLENPIYYTIYNTRSGSTNSGDRVWGLGGLIYYAGDEVGLKDAVDNITSLDNKYKFYFTGSHDALYIHNAATGKKLASLSSWTEEGTAWAVGVSPKGNGLAFGPQGGLNSNNCWNEKNYATDASVSDFTTWSANDDGSIFVVEPVSEHKFPETDKFYTIECPLFYNVQGEAKGLYVDTDGSIKWNTVDLTNKNFYWVPTIKDGYVVLKNVGTSTYLGAGTMSEDETPCYITPLGSNQFGIKGDNYVIHANGHGNGAYESGSLADWANNANTASAWSFVEREDPDAITEVTIVYNFVYEGETKYSQTYNTIVGQEYLAISVTFPFGVSAVKPEGTICADDIEVIDGVNTITKEITLNISLPFEYADNYDNINKWYFLQFHATSKNYLYYGGSADVLDASKTTFDAEDDNYYWGFVGNPFDGYTVVNRGAGADKALNAGESGAIVGDEAQVMTLTASSHAEDGFFMQNLTGSYTQRFNKQNNKVVYWSGADAGSTFMTEDPDEALVALVNDFKTYASSGLGYVGGYTVDKADAINAIETYADMKAFKAANTPITFDESKYYRIQNVYRTTFISVTGTDRVLKAEDKANVSQLWQIENGTTDGKYFIKSPNAGYMQAVGTNALAENGAEFNISSFGEGYGQYAIKSDNNMLAGINASTLGTWWNGTIDSDMSYRFIETTDVEINIDEFASIYLPFAVEVEGATAYAIEETNSTHAILAEKADIPANQGAILAGNGTAKLNIINDATSDWTNNMLKGSTIDTYVEGPAYVLGTVNDVTGLYKAKLKRNENGEEGTTHFKNNANKAYLVVEGASESVSYGLRLPGATGIEEVVVENGVKAIYDLTGRRVESVTVPGIYIVNGKKVLVK